MPNSIRFQFPGISCFWKCHEVSAVTISYPRARNNTIKIGFKNSRRLSLPSFTVRFQTNSISWLSSSTVGIQPKLAKPSATIRNRNLKQKKKKKKTDKLRGIVKKKKKNSCLNWLLLKWECCRPWRKNSKSILSCVVFCTWSSKIHSHCGYAACAVSHFIHDNNVETIVSRSKCQPTRCGYCAWCDVVTVAL